MLLPETAEENEGATSTLDEIALAARPDNEKAGVLDGEADSEVDCRKDHTFATFDA